ncbi:MAG: GAF domain-containing protein [Terriglobales bacterium]
MPALDARHVTFLKLQPAVICIECELISYNNTDQCLACGSRAVLSLARVLGGSLRNAPTARIVADKEVDCVAAEVFSASGLLDTSGGRLPAVHAALDRVVEHACTLTCADGGALALSDGQRMVCTAQLGHAAPSLGAEVATETGISGLCVRTGRTLRCDDAARDSRVDLRRCRQLGVQSLVVAPLLNLDKVIGILTVMSAQAYAFDDRRVATVQALAALTVLALRQEHSQPSCLPRESVAKALPRFAAD